MDTAKAVVVPQIPPDVTALFARKGMHAYTNTPHATITDEGEHTCDVFVRGLGPYERAFFGRAHRRFEHLVRAVPIAANRDERERVLHVMCIFRGVAAQLGINDGKDQDTIGQFTYKSVEAYSDDYRVLLTRIAEVIECAALRSVNPATNELVLLATAWPRHEVALRAALGNSKPLPGALAEITEKARAAAKHCKKSVSGKNAIAVHASLENILLMLVSDRARLRDGMPAHRWNKCMDWIKANTTIEDRRGFDIDDAILPPVGELAQFMLPFVPPPPPPLPRARDPSPPAHRSPQHSVPGDASGQPRGWKPLSKEKEELISKWNTAGDWAGAELDQEIEEIAAKHRKKRAKEEGDEDREEKALPKDTEMKDATGDEDDEDSDVVDITVSNANAKFVAFFGCVMDLLDTQGEAIYYKKARSAAELLQTQKRKDSPLFLGAIDIVHLAHGAITGTQTERFRGVHAMLASLRLSLHQIYPGEKPAATKSLIKMTLRAVDLATEIVSAREAAAATPPSMGEAGPKRAHASTHDNNPRETKRPRAAATNAEPEGSDNSADATFHAYVSGIVERRPQPATKANYAAALAAIRVLESSGTKAGEADGALLLEMLNVVTHACNASLHPPKYRASFEEAVPGMMKKLMEHVGRIYDTRNLPDAIKLRIKAVDAVGKFVQLKFANMDAAAAAAKRKKKRSSGRAKKRVHVDEEEEEEEEEEEDDDDDGRDANFDLRDLRKGRTVSTGVIAEGVRIDTVKTKTAAQRNARKKMDDVARVDSNISELYGYYMRMTQYDKDMTEVRVRLTDGYLKDLANGTTEKLWIAKEEADADLAEVLKNPDGPTRQLAACAKDLYAVLTEMFERRIEYARRVFDAGNRRLDLGGAKDVVDMWKKHAAEIGRNLTTIAKLSRNARWKAAIASSGHWGPLLQEIEATLTQELTNILGIRSLPSDTKAEIKRAEDERSDREPRVEVPPPIVKIKEEEEERTPRPILLNMDTDGIEVLTPEEREQWEKEKVAEANRWREAREARVEEERRAQGGGKKKKK